MFKIESVNLDGFGRKVFVNEDIIWFNGIVIDYFNSRIYWVDIKKQTIEISDMEGQDRYVVYILVSRRYLVSILQTI